MPTETSPKPYDWLRTVARSVAELEKIPAQACPTEFSFEQLAALLKGTFELSDLHIDVKKSEWLSADAVPSGIAQPLNTLAISLAAFSTPAHWLMAEADTSALMNAVISVGAEVYIYDKAILEGFYHFVALEVLHSLEQIGFSQNLALRLTKQESVPQEGLHYCLDIAVTIKDQVIRGRLVLPRELVGEWTQHFSTRSLIPLNPHAEIPQTPVTVHLEAGRVSLQHHEWRSVKAGDFVLLDSCTLIPGAEKGRILLTVAGIPIFRGMLKSEKVKILEYPLYHEVQTPMNRPPENEHDDDLSEIDNEIEDNLEEEDSIEPLEEKPQIAIPHPAAAEPASINEIPLNIVVEVGRLQMTLAKLAELQPGSLLDLSINPDEGVSLVVNGHCIGRGELLKIGESLGVRILEKA